MKKNITYILYVFALAGLAACSDDSAQVMPAEGDGTLTISYTIPGSKVQSRAGEVTSSEAESKVARMDLIYFASDVHSNGAFVAHQAVTGTAYDLRKNTFTVAPPAEVQEASAYQVLIIANLDKYMNSNTIADYCSKTFTSHNQAWNELCAASLTNSGGEYTYPSELLMSGTAVKPAGKNELSFELLRAAVRIEVKTANNNITLQSAELHNLPSTVPFFRTGEVGSESTLHVAETPSSNMVQLYTFENILDVTDPLARINRATCLLLQVEKTSSGYGTNKWYRVDLNIVNDMQQLKRNHVYTVTLADVTAAGAASKEEAYNSASFLPGTITIKEFAQGGIYNMGEFEYQ